MGEQIDPVTYVQGKTGGGEVDVQLNPDAPLRVGTPVGRIRPVGDTTTELFFKLGLRLKTTYGGEGSKVGLPELREIHAHIVGIIESFAPRWV